MRFAKVIFFLAGLYGLLVLVPQYFREEWIGRAYPPPITHPEYFYGFIGIGLAWQILFLCIAFDPVRLRTAMLPAILEKISYGAATIVLYQKGRLAGNLLAFGLFDLILAALFVMAWFATRRTETPVTSSRA